MIQLETLHSPDASMLKNIEAFDAWACDQKNTGVRCKFDGINRALGGFQPGWHIIGGESNTGKSALLVNIIQGILTVNKDVFVLDFTLDDSLYERMARFVAADSQVLINAVRRPYEFTEYQQMLDRRNAGIARLKSMVNRYHCYDSSYTTDIETIDQTIFQYMEYLDRQAEEEGLESPRRLVVTIDSFHDITTGNYYESDKSKYDYLAQRVSDIATKYMVPIITTAELRKSSVGTHSRRPSKDDLREAAKIGYEAKSIMLVYNEVSLRGEAAQVYYVRPQSDKKEPVLEVHFAKNKYTEFKGRLFFYFAPETCTLMEADRDASRRFIELISG